MVQLALNSESFMHRWKVGLPRRNPLTESGGDGPSAIVKLVAVNAASPLRCRDQSYRRTRSSRWDQDQR
jgi:hypothetical protein